MYLQSSLALALLRVAVVHGYANPGACSGACNIHDPALIQNGDGTYYRFSTGNGISFASASSIEGPWTAVGSVLPDGSSIENSGSNDPWVRILTFLILHYRLHKLHGLFIPFFFLFFFFSLFHIFSLVSPYARC